MHLFKKAIKITQMVNFFRRIQKSVKRYVFRFIEKVSLHGMNLQNAHK